MGLMQWNVFQQEFITECDEPLGEAWGGFVAGELEAFLHQDFSRVESRFDEHKADASFVITSEDGEADRVGTAPTGQQREVRVKYAEFKGVDGGLRDDDAEVDDDAEPAFKLLSGDEYIELGTGVGEVQGELA